MQYITNDWEQESLPANQKSFAIIHVFTGQMATTMLDLYKKKAILKLRVPANMTQLLDLRVHGYVKRFTRRKLKNWYSLQISKQLDEGKPLHDIDDPLQFSLLKRIYTEWMVKLYNQMTAIPSKETGG